MLVSLLLEKVTPFLAQRGLKHPKFIGILQRGTLRSPVVWVSTLAAMMAPVTFRFLKPWRATRQRVVMARKVPVETTFLVLEMTLKWLQLGLPVRTRPQLVVRLAMVDTIQVDE